MKTTIALLHTSSICSHRPLTVPHPSSTPFFIIYTHTAKLKMLAKPMKNEEKQKTLKTSDTILALNTESDIEMHFTNEAMKKCIFDSKRGAKETSFLADVPLALAKTTFLHSQMHQSCCPRPPSLVPVHSSFGKSEG